MCLVERGCLFGFGVVCAGLKLVGWLCRCFWCVVFCCAFACSSVGMLFGCWFC